MNTAQPTNLNKVFGLKPKPVVSYPLVKLCRHHKILSGILPRFRRAEDTRSLRRWIVGRLCVCVYVLSSVFWGRRPLGLTACCEHIRRLASRPRTRAMAAHDMLEYPATKSGVGAFNNDTDAVGPYVLLHFVVCTVC